MTSLDTLQLEQTDRQVTLRVEQWAHIVSVLEVANGGQARVTEYLLTDLITEICRQLVGEDDTKDAS